MLATAEKLRRSAAAALVGGNARGRRAGAATPINTIGFDRREVVELPDGALAFADAPAYGIGRLAETEDVVTLTHDKQSPGSIVLQNRHLIARFSADGRLQSLIHRATGREAIAPGMAGNVLALYDDRPTAHDAWDIDPFHLDTGRPEWAAYEMATIHEQLPLRAQVRFAHRVGRQSHVNVVARLDAESERLEFYCEADWQEDHKLLKVAFPLAVRSMSATYEIPFGAIERPTHFNTSHDAAKFEVPAHRFADLAEPGFGVALLNDSKYGHSCHRNTMRLSLLRAPTYPDPSADRGSHRFAYALYPHAGPWHESSVVKQAATFNQRLMMARGGMAAAEPRSFFRIDNRNLVLDTIKQAEDGGGLVLRLYECHGARGVARIRVGVPFSSANYCNGLEDDGQPPGRAGDADLVLPFAPFQIISIRLRLA